MTDTRIWMALICGRETRINVRLNIMLCTYLWCKCKCKSVPKMTSRFPDESTYLIPTYLERQFLCEGQLQVSVVGASRWIFSVFARPHVEWRRMKFANGGSETSYAKGFLVYHRARWCLVDPSDTTPGKKTEHRSSKIQKYTFVHIPLAGFKFLSQK